MEKVFEMDNDFREVIVDYFRLFYRPLFSFVYVATKSSEVKGRRKKKKEISGAIFRTTRI